MRTKALAEPTLVFIHGGQHSKSCWQPTIDAIRKYNPSANILAVNLPGHGDNPGDLATLSIAQCVNDVTSQILATSPQRVILIGHSMAGITIPGVTEKLGKALVSKIIFLACCIPPNGQRVLDTLHPPMSIVAKVAAKITAVSPPFPRILASWVFANGMTKQQKNLVFNDLRAESTMVTKERIDRSNFPKVPMDWIITMQDRAVRPSLQRKFIKNLGGVDKIFELNTCHDAMISEPDQLANLILSRC
tara:strand:+ start:53021 stop:53761 length:741 start_codon:yes stop_codon:yes gene_type:complete